MGNTCCELQDSKEMELGLTRPVNASLLAVSSKVTKTKSESTGDQQTITFGSKAPIIILKEARDDPRDLLQHFAGSPVEQTPVQSSNGPLKFLIDPIGKPIENLQSSQTEEGRIGSQQLSEIAKNQTQQPESRFKKASDGATKSASGSKNNQTSKVRIMLKNLRG